MLHYKWSEKVFMIKNVKNMVAWIYAINGPNRKEIVGTFCKKKIGKNKSKRFQG